MGNTNTADFIDHNGCRFVDVPPVTRTHEVLLELGHRVTRQVAPDGTLNAYTIIANTDHCTQAGTVPEAAWALCDAAEDAPTYSHPRRTAVYVDGPWIDGWDTTDPSWFDAPRGYQQRVFSHFE